MANYSYITPAGIIVADTATIKADVQEEYKSVFGEDFVVDDESPEGLLISAEVTSRQSVVRNNAQVANQINPNLTGGVFLDAMIALTGDSRGVGARSTVAARLFGVRDTIIPMGSLASTSSGDSFQLTQDVTIGILGFGVGIFESVEFGPIPAANGQLNVVVTSILGWETVSNDFSATLGSSTPGDAATISAWRQKRGLQGRSISEAVSSNVRAVGGVKSLSFRENRTGAPLTIDGVPLVRNSVWTCVDGGTDADIANALLRSKTGGANWNGSVTVSLVDPHSGQDVDVMFERPTGVDILVRITTRSASAATDPTNEVRQAIIDYSNGLIDGEEGFVVGGDVSPYELGGAVSRTVPGVFVTRVEIAINVAPFTFSADTISINIDELATISEANIQVIRV